jgi:fructuronate reductase
LGLLTLALERRRQDGAGPITLISCDNIPANGDRLRAALLGFAAEKNPSLIPWIEKQTSFPCAMVDRIVPASSPDDFVALAADIGLRDEAAVFGEPFRQWVIEDRFAADRPPWDLAGVQFVADAEPYEHIKMRILNAAQSTLSHWGALVGHDFSWQAATDPVLSGLIERMLDRETRPTLPLVEGMEVGAYLANAMARIRNTAIHHRCHQIGTDGSQKITQRLLAPLRARRARNLAATGLERAVAGWIAYVAAGAARYGARWAPSDPFAAEIAARAEAADDFVELARSVLALDAIFGDDLADDALARRMGGHLAGLLGPDPHGYLREALSDG